MGAAFLFLTEEYRCVKEEDLESYLPLDTSGTPCCKANLTY